MRTRSAFVAILAACNPATTRPDFQPFPETARVVVMARRERVIPFLATLVAAESLRVRRASPVDGYLETDWYDTRDHRSIRDGQLFGEAIPLPEFRGGIPARDSHASSENKGFRSHVDD